MVNPNKKKCFRNICYFVFSSDYIGSEFWRRAENINKETNIKYEYMLNKLIIWE